MSGAHRASAAALLLLLASAGPAYPQSTAPEAEVLEVVRQMMRAMETRDTALLESLFDPGARLVGIRQREGERTLQSLPVRQFSEFVARDRRGRWIERIWEPEVRVTGTLATVWARYDFHFDRRFSHCGTDAFQLLSTPDGWKIVAIADTYETEGCPARVPPE